MKSKLAYPVAALVASAALAFPGVAVAAETPTKVTIHGPQGDFYGKVKSDKASCVPERKVKVFKIKNSGPEKIAADFSNDEGQWSVGTTGQKNGRFFAKAPATPGCLAGRSETIRLIDGEEQ